MSTAGSGAQPGGAALSWNDDALLRVVALRWSSHEKNSTTLYGILREKTLALAGPRPTALALTVAATAAAAWYETVQRSAGLQITESRHPDLRDVAYGRAFKRWLAAARTLATIQRLPAMVQVNVAHGPQQVNVGADPK